MTPYIGITGFTAADEVAGVVAAWPDEPGRLLMCGALLSNARLSGESSDAPNRCPPTDAIAGIFSDDPRCLNLVHYRPQPGANLADALARASEVGGPNCHGVQINATRGVPWPDPAALVEYRECSQPQRIVLQAGREAMASVDGDADALARRCAYAHLTTCGGRSEDWADTGAAAWARLLALADAAPDLGLSARGLCAATCQLLSRCCRSGARQLDAEGRLRDGE